MKVDLNPFKSIHMTFIYEHRLFKKKKRHTKNPHIKGDLTVNTVNIFIKQS